jgi:hypothetical protein
VAGAACDRHQSTFVLNADGNNIEAVCHQPG